MTRRLLLKIFILTAFVLCLFVLQFYWDIPSLFNPDNIQLWLAEAGNMAPLFYMLVMATAVVISPIPSLPLDVAAGAAFGPVLGTLYSALGALGGAVISFMITRVMGRELLEPSLGGTLIFVPIAPKT